MKPLPIIPIRSGAMPGALIEFFPPRPESRLTRRAVTSSLIATAASNQIYPDSLTSLAELHPPAKTQTGKATLAHRVVANH
jgi:hypothetical protein